MTQVADRGGVAASLAGGGLRSAESERKTVSQLAAPEVSVFELCRLASLCLLVCSAGTRNHRNECRMCSQFRVIR